MYMRSTDKYPNKALLFRLRHSCLEHFKEFILFITKTLKQKQHYILNNATLIYLNFFHLGIEAGFLV